MRTSILKFAIIIFSISLILASCKKDTSTEENLATTCDINDPLETIQWLKETKETFEISMSPSAKRITQYFYQGECVFLINGCVGCDDNLTTVYNVDQEVICEFGGIGGVNTCPDFEAGATGEINLYGN